MDKMINHNVEDVKRYWNNRPCNIRHSNKKIGTKEYFDEVEKRKYFVEPHIKSFAEFDSWRDKEVLEIGCGIGTAVINFARCGANVTAVDLSQESIDIAKQRAKVFNLENKIKFYQGNIEELSSFTPVKVYDLVYSFGVIHHTPNPSNVIKQLKKYMDTSSRLKLMLYAKNSWKNMMIEAGYDQPEAQHGCPVAYTYSKDEVYKLLNGFKVTKIEKDHIFKFVLDKYLNYEYEIQPWFASMPDKFFRVLEKNLGWHMLIDAKLD